MRPRATLRDLRMGASEVEQTQEESFPTGELDPVKFARSLNAAVEKATAEEERLAVFEIRYSMTSVPSGLHKGVNTKSVQKALAARVVDKIPSGSFFFPSSNSIIGMIPLEEDGESAEALIGATLKEVSAPLQIDGWWFTVDCLSGCVYLDAVEEPDTRSLYEALQLTVAETGPSMNFLVFNPYLKGRKTREEDLAARVIQIIESNSIGHSFDAIEEIDSGNTVGLEVVPSFADVETGEPFPNSDVITAATHEGIIYELGRKCRELACSTLEDSITPDISERMTVWFNIQIEELQNPGFLAGIEELALSPAQLGFVLDASAMAESKYIERTLDQLVSLGCSVALSVPNISHFDYSLLTRIPASVVTIQVDVDGPIVEYPELSKRIELLRLACARSGAELCMANVSSERQANEAEEFGASLIRGSHVAATVSNVDELVL